jgi:FAD-dependent urate hydroxylase
MRHQIIMLKEIVFVKSDTTVVIGAGPYGLSVASHLKGRGVETLVFGKTMELWKKMPAALCLKSIWTASSISDPAGKYTIDRYYALKQLTRQEPIPLSNFLNYALWFQQQAVPDVDQTYVQSLSADGKGFHLELVDGRSVKASKVVLASGIGTFAYVPEYARDLPSTLAGHTSMHTDLSVFKDRKVVVIGNGQSALEYAAMLNEIGASVELIARGEVRWHTKVLYERTGPARHIFYPPGDVGPPGINWLVAFPALYRHFPDRVKSPVHRRAVLPGGAKWLRSRIEGYVQITEGTQIVRATPQGQELCLTLDDGTTREVDYLMLGTGYKPSVQKLPYLDASLLARIEQNNGYPVLDKSYEASVPGMYFAGILAGYTFGPTCRFVSGTKALAGRIARN